MPPRPSSRGDGVQGRIGDGDPLIELDEFAGRLETGLVGEVVAIGLERPERLHLAAGAMQSEHQLAPKPVPQRMLGDEAFELSCRIAVPAEIEQRLHEDEIVGLEPVDADVVEGEQVAPWRRPQCSLANDCAQARDV